MAREFHDRMRDESPHLRSCGWRREELHSGANRRSFPFSSGLTDTPGDPQDSRPGGRFPSAAAMRQRGAARIRARLWTSEAHRAGEDHAHAQARGSHEELMEQLLLLMLRHGWFLPEPPTGSAGKNVRSTDRNGKYFGTRSEDWGTREVRKRTAAPRSRPLFILAWIVGRFRLGGGAPSRGQPGRSALPRQGRAPR